MDGVQAANSGHPGMPMGMADVAAVIWDRFLKCHPVDPQWPDRDRFVLSAGHGSMLIYSLLHLAGYDLPIEELKNFRQWESKTPGHPEYGHTPGVETTTGPLGQGCGNAVGMAVAEAMLAERFNTGDAPVVDHFTYVISSDGEMMEGVSHEVFALAGHLGLGKLIVLYDDNQITIEGDTDLAYSDDVQKRFEGYHWQVLDVDGHDHGAIESAVQTAREETAKPTLIRCRTTIGYGSPNKAGTHGCHGSPLGEDEVKRSKEQLGIPVEPLFHVPEELQAAMEEKRKIWAQAYGEWQQRFEAWRATNPEKAAEWDAAWSGKIPNDLSEQIGDFAAGDSMATRKASGAVLQDLAKALPHLVGGSADLAPSNNSLIKNADDIGPHAFNGRNFHFGVRELGMAAIASGIALHGGFIPYTATFLVFADFMRPAIRLACLMKQRVVYLFTHDSFCVGEDGPTHEPIETLTSLRIIPDMTVIRPSEATETKEAWIAALQHSDGPTALCLTRQSLPVIDRNELASAEGLHQGAYILWESGDTPEIILMASGSEVSLVLEAGEKLAAEGSAVRVVSFPSWELFERQSKAYRDSVLPSSCTKRLAVEAGCSTGWERYTGTEGRTIYIDHFGASAPFKVLQEQFGFTVENVIRVARDMR